VPSSIKNYLLYTARDNSGFILYNNISGETTFIAYKDELAFLNLNTEDELFTDLPP